MMMTIIAKIHCLNRAWLNRPFHNLLNSVNTALQSCEICVPLPPTITLISKYYDNLWGITLQTPPRPLPWETAVVWIPMAKLVMGPS